MDALHHLYDSLDAQPRPEDVAALVLAAQPSLSRHERSVIGLRLPGRRSTGTGA